MLTGPCLSLLMDGKFIGIHFRESFPTIRLMHHIVIIPALQVLAKKNDIFLPNFMRLGFHQAVSYVFYSIAHLYSIKDVNNFCFY
jgi:hypothetical protein